MRLYQSEYGQTELRLYTTAYMARLAAVQLWYVLTVLRERRERFASGALVLAGLALLALHAANPDALIVRVNAANAATGGPPFDTSYATRLSADAVPALVAALSYLPPAESCDAAQLLLRRWGETDDDWRSWSWSRAHARQTVRSGLGLRPGCAPAGVNRSP
jgi:hypothetical protein